MNEGQIVMVVNGTRYLLNEDARSIDDSAKTILSVYPADASVHFEEPQMEDLLPHRKYKSLFL